MKTMKTHHLLARKAPASACPVRRRLGGLYSPELLEARIAPATIIVNSLLDNGDGANTTLREAILMANDPATHPGADTIVFKIPAASLPGTIVLAGAEIPITDTLTINGLGIDLLSVSGNDLSRIFKIDDGTGALKPTTISGLTLTDGKAALNGGALYSTEPLSLKNVVIRSSSCGNRGGGAFVKTAGKISVASSSIVHNEAIILNGGGGGLYLNGSAGVSIVKTTIADNTALKNGGLYAIAKDPKSVIVIDKTIIANNNATSGIAGGARLAGAADGKIIIKNSLITGNSATNVGGGLYLREGNLLITNTTFSHNTAADGGAIGVDAAKSFTVSGSRFIGNSATAGAGDGGGALFFDGPATVVKIAGSLFAANTSAARGGAISHNGTLTLSIASSSFLSNTSTAGGAVFVADGAVLTMQGSILSGNTADVGGALSADTGSVLNLTGNKFTDNKATYGGAIRMRGLAANAVTANLSGNLFQANVADVNGGAVLAAQDSLFTSKADKFIGNVARTGQGGGVYLINAGGIFITSSLIQGNVAASSGGGAIIASNATLTGVKVLDNIAGPGGRGGGLRISAGTVVIAKSLVTGNVANDGGGIFFNLGTTTLPSTIVKGNAAGINPNIGSA